jgi:hypothetical protein
VRCARELTAAVVAVVEVIVPSGLMRGQPPTVLDAEQIARSVLAMTVTEPGGAGTLGP